MRKAFIGILVCLLMACSEKAEKTNVEVAASQPVSTSDLGQSTSTSEEETSTPQETSEEAEETAPQVESSATAPAASTGGVAGRTESDNSLTTSLEMIARSLEAKKLEYISELSQDCSGIFHQIKDSIQLRMPTLADQSKYAYPSFSKDRNSRQIADWYYRNNNLLIVQDPMAERNKIRPGSVMFFGRTEEKYSNLSIDLLTNPGKFVHDGEKGKIMHIAVVTSVVKDDAGNVIKYTMMHGRNKRHTASRSAGNYDGPGGFAKAFAKFPFGNWNQQWVAMANIETPK